MKTIGVPLGLKEPVQKNPNSSFALCNCPHACRYILYAPRRVRRPAPGAPTCRSAPDNIGCNVWSSLLRPDVGGCVKQHLC